ncbi:type IX secretion system sortase PorU [Brumimicrobium glaciale]|uniref:Type IX secretion system sortase PorU n=1 Tax=Brumimicrobium glaciale TaxID=200475 RepID=A0A4V1WFD9_9FLAO|nr:type IX secretion system sortase PorU [Brumimicrobium glaciale]RYM32856.1 type IX secretion system sortase PorU [Brumimicrobium glaciale]
MSKIINQLVLSLGVLMTSFLTVGQNEISIDLNWDTTPSEMTLPSSSFEFPTLENSFVDEKEFLYLHKFKRLSASSEWNFDLLSYQSSPVDQVTKNFINTYKIKVETVPVFSLKNNKEKGSPRAILSLVPFVRINGEIRKIESIVFQQTSKTINYTKGMPFVPESVLRSGSGEWYKITVSGDGIYKLDYSFLQNAGIDVGNLNPSDLNIYGNSFGRLPELNSEYRPDDLLKNDILVVGEADGSFDQNDYILFYGKGPHKWEEVNGVFNRNLNIYSNETAYFININSSGTPARISNAALSNQPTTHVVSDYDSYTFHEQELLSLLKGGQRWYGEQFDANLSQSFSMFIPNINPSGEARVRAFMGSKSGDTNGNTNFTVTYNNSTVGVADMGWSNDDSYSRGGFVTAPGVFNPTSSNITFNVKFNRISPANIGYLDFIEVNARSQMKYFDGMTFRDLNSVGIGNVAEMQISSFPSNGVVWEITSPTQPKNIAGNNSGGIFDFKVNADSLREFVTFKGSNYKVPTFLKRVQHQNLHALAEADYLIVTHPTFTSQANRLANLHKNNGLSVHVVTMEQVYNEFSGGTQDPTAIRYFAKMFYDRAEGDLSKQPKYLMLFGDGTYDPLDRLENNNYMIPVYETVESESYTGSLVTDDYFGLLDDTEEFGTNDLMDIAVGRFVATTPLHAKTLVNKVEHYMKNGSSLYASSNLACGEDGYISTHGDWRQKYIAIADDENGGQFVIDHENFATYVKNNHPEMNVKKIYSDAYVQITTAGGERYPDVNNEINRSIESGSLVTCYVGHGGSKGAAQERIMTIGDVVDYKNIDKLTLFVSATCEFARIDDNRMVSIGELMALNEVGGAIALMTTTRAVYIGTNSAVTGAFFKNVFKRGPNNEPRTFGDIMIDTKNTLGGGADRRSFMLLGDPALRIALPFEKVVLDSVNNLSIISTSDTLRALSKAKLSGHIEDQFGNVLTGFNGVIQPSIYDKPANRATLGQDADSPVENFQQQENILFKGKATVTNGYFDFEFIVPKDINYSYGKGKASFYSWSKADINAGGYSEDFFIGGIDTTGLNDLEGPEIEIFLNDDSFVNGGISNETPILIAKLYDESGINTVGNGIGHDITLILDDETSKAKVLNSFYESDLDTYKSGSLKFQMDKLESGLHTLTFKAWDVNNNSSEKVVEFTVHEEKDIALDHVLNYPNPFTTHTEFFFEHNQVCAALETQIEIFTVTGRLIKTINETVETRGFRTEGIVWDGRDDFGDQLAKGVYVYRVTIKNPDGQKTQEMQKLYLLK